MPKQKKHKHDWKWFILDNMRANVCSICHVVKKVSITNKNPAIRNGCFGKKKSYPFHSDMRPIKKKNFEEAPNGK